MRSLFAVKTFLYVLALAAFGYFAAASVGQAAPPVVPLADSVLMEVDWQDPQALPRRFRNHCYTDSFSGRPYCSDHCGGDYQVFYCSPQSFGCCRVGYGYCDWNGLLRCRP
jgi:hypothetical protein